MIFYFLKAGGIVMIPLLILAITALAITIDKILLFHNLARIPQKLVDIIEKYNFDWKLLSDNLNKLNSKNYYRKFLSIIIETKQNELDNHHQTKLDKIPIWWIESRSSDEAKNIEKKLNQNLWILETIITSSPLLGLVGTIIGMMSSFKIIGNSNIINPTAVTAGVAESLIATGFGLIIAIIALFAFNFFSRKQDQVIDEMERLGSKLIDHIKIDRNLQD
jgi:biopolymer transport protein ExbB